MSDAWVVTREGAPSDLWRVLCAAENDDVPVEWAVIELLARWEHQCNDITLRGYGSPGDEEPAIEIVAFDSGPWEFTVNDPRRLDTGLLRDLGGRWVRITLPAWRIRRNNLIGIANHFACYRRTRLRIKCYFMFCTQPAIGREIGRASCRERV